MKRLTSTFYLGSFVLAAVVLIFSAFPQQAQAQADRPLYFLPIVPQKNTINPAYVPEYKFYIGIPFLSSVKTGFENTLKYEEVFKEEGDSLYLDRDYIMSKLQDKNSLNFNLAEEYLVFGFRAQKNYFHVRIADQVNANITITKNLIELLLYGNGNENLIGKNIDLGGNAINMTYYREYMLGYSRQVNEKLTVGGSVKYLQGIASLYTGKSDLNFYTDPTDFTLTVSSDFRINTSSPWRGDGEVKPESLSPNSQNPGFAVDLGGQYIIDEKWDVSASLINLGSITWNADLKNYATEDPSNEVVFSGFNISEYFINGELDQENLNKVLDSISDEFGIVENTQKYKTPLPALLNICGNYHLTDKDRFGLLFRHQFLNNLGWTTATLGYTRTFGRDVNLTLTNTFVRSSYLNPGIGFAANLGPVQLYLLTENVIAPINLKSTKVFVFRFGVNLVFGKKARVDTQNIEGEDVLKEKETPAIQE